MVEVTKEQIVEVLERVKSYARWCYGNKKAIENLYARKIEIDGYQFRLSIDEETGYIVFTIDGTDIKGIYNCQLLLTKPYPDTILNTEYRYQCVNYKEIPEEFRGLFSAVSVMVISYFQRLAAASFYANITPESIDAIAEDLDKATDPPENTLKKD